VGARDATSVVDSGCAGDGVVVSAGCDKVIVMGDLGSLKLNFKIGEHRT